MSEKNGGCCVIDFYFIFGINNSRRSQVYFLFSFYFRRSSAFNEISLELEKGKKKHKIIRKTEKKKMMMILRRSKTTTAVKLKIERVCKYIWYFTMTLIA